MLELAVKKHSTLALRCLRLLPTLYQSEDSNRLSLAFFALSTLDLLGTLDQHLSLDERHQAVGWIYTLQQSTGGFAGSSAGGAATTAHMVMSYCAVLSLAILKDDLERLNTPGLVAFIKSCQTSRGSFLMYPHSPEEDVRSTYCAFVLLHLLGDFWHAIDTAKAICFLQQCQTYDGAYAQAPGLESQGGSTFCAVAALSVAQASIRNADRLTSWLVQRQTCPSASLFLDDESDSDSDDSGGGPGPSQDDLHTQAALKAARMAGFQGRSNKEPDACYSWWIGAALRLLCPDLTLQDTVQEQAFLGACQSLLIGGIANFPGRHPDIYHTYLALAALSLAHVSPLKPIDPAINVSVEALEHWRCTLKQRRASRS